MAFKVGNLVRFKEGITIWVVVAVDEDRVDCALLPRASHEPVLSVHPDAIEKAIGGRPTKYDRGFAD